MIIIKWILILFTPMPMAFLSWWGNEKAGWIGWVIGMIAGIMIGLIYIFCVTGPLLSTMWPWKGK